MCWIGRRAASKQKKFSRRSGLLDYSATKGASHAFTKALASKLLDKGVRVNAVAPGSVWTPLNPADSPPERIKTFGKGTDMGRPAQPEELSPAYVFLASPACASYITGIVLPITGSVGVWRSYLLSESACRPGNTCASSY